MKKEPYASVRSQLAPFLLGGLAGVAIGLLIAPKAGSEVRNQIRNIATGTRDRISSTISKGVTMYDGVKIAMTTALEAGRQAYVQEREKYQTAV